MRSPATNVQRHGASTFTLLATECQMRFPQSLEGKSRDWHPPNASALGTLLQAHAISEKASVAKVLHRPIDHFTLKLHVCSPCTANSVLRHLAEEARVCSKTIYILIPVASDH